MKSLLLLSLVALFVCAAPHSASARSGDTAQAAAEDSFRARYGCDSIDTRKTGYFRWEITGCGRRSIFQCNRDAMCQETPAKMVGKDGKSLEPRVTESRSKKDKLLKLEAVLPFEAVQLRFWAKPMKFQDKALLIISKGRGFTDKKELKCGAALVVNGSVAPLGEPKVSYTNTRLELKYEVTIEDLVKWAGARIAGRFCDHRFRLDSKDSAALQEFLLRFREEQALNGIMPTAPESEQPQAPPVTGAGAT